MTKPAYIPEENWRSSSYSQSNGGECIEVADGIAHTVPVRDSKNPTGPILITSNASWTAFVAFAKAATV
ncbi:DUF397 domain-containing protein [Streptomyces scopuliridis]|uniref:DUF397 domain-containing protein n=1 Tax=Streptomyces scopuliridis TaxID=452529 RepID=A0ACD4ZJM2_9ACTN|nr:DUF397 domain-containing protein [Streptomyces scopuliridis]WSB98193.1 DUF397 domain-containing protein [Streptomyces scopuliridis]WSC08105.1 DUF397 domain-containing protein [Streptomyces scopuliridis]